jgi:hypothetical protein
MPVRAAGYVEGMVSLESRGTLEGSGNGGVATVVRLGATLRPPPTQTVQLRRAGAWRPIPYPDLRRFRGRPLARTRGETLLEGLGARPPLIVTDVADCP